MMKTINGLSAAVGLFVALGNSMSLPLQRRGGNPTPSLIHDPNTDPNCTWWWDADDGLPCEIVVEWTGLTIAKFAKWNPSIQTCADWEDGHSYCIEVATSPEPPKITSTTASEPPRDTSTSTSTSTTTASPSTTSPSNGVSTPQPFQPGMASNCNKFHKVVSGDQCSTVATKYGISLTDMYKWNPGVGNSCQSLWLDYYVCVGVIGQQGTPTNPSNGIKTPLPIQPGMVNNCYKFHFVQPGAVCADITAKTGVSLSQLYQWNPTIGNTCSSLWANIYVCVGVFNNVPAYQQHGCYSEVSQRALSYSGVTGQKDMTIEFCGVYCMVEKGRKLFGVQFGGECWCGDSLTVGSVKVADGECSMPCTGNPGQQCGGSERLNIYGSTSSPAPLAYKYHGCYTEGTNTRALGISRLESASLTVEQCAQYCLAQTGTNHFAVEYGRECWCGNNLGTGAVSVPESECNMGCAGNFNQRCGAANRLNLYSRQLERPPMKFRYEGCFTELSTGGRALNGAVLADDGLTVERCAKFCIDKGFPRFGVQFARECFCGGQRAPGSVAAPEAECNMACSGNTGQKCGGNSRLNVFLWP